MDQAEILFLHISDHHNPAMMRIVNRCWFCSHVTKVATPQEEHHLFTTLPTRQQNNQMFDAVFADFTSGTRLPVDRQLKLIDFLRACRRPLITLTSNESFFAHSDSPHWIHITLPAADPASRADAVMEAITNFWFNLPTLKLV